MQNNQVFDLIMSRLGERTSPSLRAKVVLELNKRIEQLERSALVPWFLETRMELQTIALQDYVAIPSTFLREVEGGRFRMKNSEGSWVELKKKNLEFIDNYENCDPAFPEVYAISGKRFYFGYTPDSVYDIRVQVFQKSTAVADTSDEVTNDWLLEYFNYITFSTLDVIARHHVQSNELITRIKPDLDKAADDFWRDVEGRENANLEHLVGEDED